MAISSDSTRLAAAALGVASLAAPVLGQASRQELERVEPGTADVNPYDATSRVQPLEMRQPNDFGSLYEVRGRDGRLRYVRFGGSTAAVFPRSVYVRTRRGVEADVPPGTVFYLGGLPESFVAGEGARARPARGMVSYRVEPSVSQGAEGARAAPAGGERAVAEAHAFSIWAGEAHRRRRVSQLVREAAASRGATTR